MSRRAIGHEGGFRARAHAITLVSFAMLALAGAGCGIKSDALAQPTAPTVSLPVTPTTSGQTTTTQGGAFTIPSIPQGDPDTTTSTSPDTTDTTEPTPGTGSSSGETTPGGVTPAKLSEKLQVVFGFPTTPADCAAGEMFQQLSGDQIDAFFNISGPGDISSLDTSTIITFGAIATDCI